VTLLPVYRTVPAAAEPAARSLVARGDADVVLFTASSTVRHFRAFFDAAEWPVVCARTVAACIGPVTAQTARDAGLRVAITPARYTLDGLVQSLIDWGAAQKG
jgi:uroporphyrinogen III methyltransferase/synthase